MSCSLDCDRLQAGAKQIRPGRAVKRASRRPKEKINVSNKGSERVREAFIRATNQRQYRAALRLAVRLDAGDQLGILDAIRDTARRLTLQWNTGETLEGARQLRCGSIVITWSQRRRRPDGRVVEVVSCAMLEPADCGPGWKANREIPAAIVEAVLQAEVR